jgi:phage terminase large subunit-like protein
VSLVEFPQSVPNLTEASTNLYDLIKGRNLVVYPDAGLCRAIHQAVALETSRGWRIAKEKQAHKIDVVVALAQAALGAVKGAHSGRAACSKCTAVTTKHASAGSPRRFDSSRRAAAGA